MVYMEKPLNWMVKKPHAHTALDLSHSLEIFSLIFHLMQHKNMP